MSMALGMVRSSWAVQTADTVNAAAVATKAAIPGQTHYLMGFQAEFDVAHSVIHTVLIQGLHSNDIELRWDFSNGPYIVLFPVALRGLQNTDLDVTLEQSGDGAVSGRITIFGFSE